jgi:hypothetical protein
MLRLEPISKRGKQLVKAHGALWRFIRWDGMPCFNGEVGIQVESLDGTHKRNIKEQGDVNFTLVWLKG